MSEGATKGIGFRRVWVILLASALISGSFSVPASGSHGNGSMTITPTQAASGSETNTFTLTFTSGANQDGVRFTVPVGFSAPQVTNPTGAGYVTAIAGAGCAVTTGPAVSGQTVETAFNCSSNRTIQFTYANVSVPSVTTATTYSFTTETRSTMTGAGGSHLTYGVVSPQPTVTVNPPPSMSISDVTVTEGDSGTTSAVFDVTLSSSLAVPATVDYSTADGSAVAPADYQTTFGIVTFAPGVTVQQISVPVMGDTADETNESFFVNLSNPSATATIADSQGVGTITDDDDPPSVSIADSSATEGGSVTFEVTLTPASGKTATVDYSTTTGTAGSSDFSATSGAVTFVPGDTSETISVSTTLDSIDEGDETFLVDLASPINAVIGDGQAVGTIIDADDAPTCSPDSGTTPEDFDLDDTLVCSDVDTGAGSLTYAKATDPSNGSVVVNSDGTFTYTPDADYNGPDSFDFIANDGTSDSTPATYSITVTPVNDPPTAVDDTDSTDEDTAVTTDVLANDTDLDGDALEITGSTDGSDGTVSCDDGTLGCTYTPDADFNGTDSYTYTVSDGNGGTDTATVDITVNAVGGTPGPGPGPVLDNTPPEVEELVVNASSISPNGDGRLDALEFAATLSENATWAFDIESDDAPASAFSLLMASSEPVFSTSGEGPGMSLAWRGLDSDGSPVEDGTYTWRLSAKDARGNAMKPVVGTVIVDRVAMVLSDIRALSNPLRLRHRAPLAVRASLSEPGTVRARLVKKGRVVRKLGPVSSSARNAVYLRWDGRNKNGKKVRPGRYRVVLRGLDLAENLTVNRALRIRVKR